MRIVKIRTTEYTYLSHLKFPQRFLGITQAMISRPDIFPELPVEPQILVDAGNDMRTKTLLAIRGGEMERDARNIQRSICENYLNRLANCVLMRASMEATEEEQLHVVNISKFTPAKLSRNRSSIDINKQVQGVTVMATGRVGEITVRWKRNGRGIVHYDVQKTLSDPASHTADWHSAGKTSRSSITLDGFPQLTKCWVRVIAYGYDRAVSIPSNPAMGVASEPGEDTENTEKTTGRNDNISSKT